MSHDISDFSKGIVTDVDSHDAGANSLSDCVNLDLVPGKAITRYGTKGKSFVEYTYDYLTSTHLIVGTLFQYSGIELIQVVEVKCPDAREDSIRGFTSAPVQGGINPSEHCLNDRVTVLLVRVGAVANREYTLYADIHEKDKFVQLNTFVAQTSFYAADDSVPFIIPRQSAVGVGNVITSTGERGVLWFGHIKGLYGWTRDLNASPEYFYLNWLDEWRCSDAECYNSHGDIKWMLYISNVEQAWDHNSAMASDFASRYVMDYEQAMKEITSEHEIGGIPENIQIMVTAVFDGYQESRPLRFDGGVQYNEIVYDASGVEIPYGTANLPENWVVTRDELHNQFARVRMNPIEKRVAWAHTFDKYPPINDLQNLAANVHQKWYLKLMWMQPWFENGDPERTGERFSLWFNDDASDKGEHGNGAYTWMFDNGKRVGLKIHTWARRSDGTALHFSNFGALLFLLGANDAYMTRGALYNLDWEADFPDLLKEREIIKQLWSVAEAYYYTEPEHTYTSALHATRGVIDADTWYNVHTFETTDIFDGPFYHDFGLEAYAGRGVLGILPYVPQDYMMKTAGAKFFDLEKGARRLTGFRFYVKRDVVDIDYNMVREIRLDYNPADPDFGGAAETEGMRQTFRDRDGTDKDAPVWVNRTWYPPFLGSPINVFLPYYERKFMPRGSVFTGLSFRGGLSRQFIISDSDLTDLAGNSVLSSNMQRDYTRRDAPLWVRGAVCEGRLLAIRYTDKLLGYSIIGGGVPQYDIMPEEGIRVGVNDNPTHIVSWRDSYHMIFTDRAVYRMDFADGDELHWRILNTFAGHGTEWWRAILNTPGALFYVTKDGIFAYAGNKPEDITWGFWKKKFRETYAETLTENNCFAGYDSRQNRILFNLNADQIDNRVWVFDEILKAWWKYMYRDDSSLGYVSPQYMVMHENVFFLSFGDSDLRTVDFENHADGGFPQRGFTQYLITNELPPASQVELGFTQYIGFKYIAPGKLRYKMSYGPYDQGLAEDWFPYKHKKGVVLPNTRTNQMHALPPGIGRLWRVMMGQGSAFMDKDGNTDTDDVRPIEIRLISLRGIKDEQWGNT